MNHVTIDVTTNETAFAFRIIFGCFDEDSTALLYGDGR
jgi:hypothetical protein